jgi:hypothetical protein
MDYVSLTSPKGTAGSIANWVNFSDALLPLADILADAQTFIYERLRVREMKTTGTISLNEGDILTALPASTLDVICLYDQYNNKIRPREAASLLGRRSFDSSGEWVKGQPGFFSIWDESFQFDYAANSAMTFNYLIYQTPALLSATNATNFLTTRFPQLLRYACLMSAADFLNDDGKYNRFMQRYSALGESANQTEDQQMWGMEADPDYSESRF